MKFCFVSYFAYPLFYPDEEVSFGGSEVQLSNISRELALDKKNKVSFLIGDFGQQDKTQENIQIKKSVKIKNNPSLFIKISNAFTLFRLLVKTNADFYIQRSASIETGIIAFYCKLFHKKFIYMGAHEWDFSGEYVKNHGLIGKIFEFGIKNAHKIITQNEKQQSDLKANYQISSTIIKSGYKIPHTDISNKKDILWVARAVKWKNPEVFMDIAKIFPSESFTMILPPADNEKYFKQLLDRANKIKNLNVIPGVKFEEVNNYFQKAKIFINTSKYEGFPNTFIQAAMNATPIISLNVNPDNILENQKIGICAAGDIQKLTSKLDEFLNNKGKYNQYSQNAYQYAKKEHDIDLIVDKLTTALKS